MCIRDSFSTPLASLKNVDFPAPLVPISPNTLPSRMVALIWSTATISSNRFVKMCIRDRVDTIVTDSGISPQMESRIRGAGAKLIIA